MGGTSNALNTYSDPRDRWRRFATPPFLPPQDAVPQQDVPVIEPPAPAPVVPDVPALPQSATPQRPPSFDAQLPPAPEPPKMPDKIPTWRRIVAGAVGGLAGASNANPANNPVDASGLITEIKAPGYGQAMRQYGLEMERRKAIGDTEQNMADAAWKRAHADSIIRQAQVKEQTPEESFQALMRIPGMTEEEARRRVLGGKPADAPNEYRPGYGYMGPDGKVIVPVPEASPAPTVLTPGSVAIDRSGKQVAVGEPKPPETRTAGSEIFERQPNGTWKRVASGVNANTMPPMLPTTPNKNLKPGELNEDALKKYPANIQSLARQLVEYKIPLPSSFALARPNSPWNLALQAAAELDPTFDAKLYSARMSVLKDFTSGQSAKNITSLNTVIGHIDSLKKAADALNNSGVPLFNRGANWLATNTGDPRVKSFELARNAVADELTRVFRQTGGTETDVQGWKSQVDAAGSPAQLKAVTDKALELLASRVGALKDQFERGMGKPKNFRFFNDKSRSILKSLGQNPDDMDFATGGGTAISPVGQQVAGGGPLTAEEARSYLARAGGDKEKARQLARADGRTF